VAATPESSAAREPEDIWAAWLRHRRTGGDSELEAAITAGLAVVRDRVLDNARLEPGETLLDVGCGNGLIAFGALERGAGRVVFSDVSQPLLDDCRAAAAELGVLDRSAFLLAPADDLHAVDDASIDVVTTRSVLIYVKDKRTALEEFHRVLDDGGRISLFEPINVYFDRDGPCWSWDTGTIDDLIRKVDDLYESYQPRDDPMLDFDERDLFELVRATGFAAAHMELKVDITPIEPRRWDAFLHASGNPKIPTMAEAMDMALTADERERLTAHLRPLVEKGIGVDRRAVAFLWADKR
jgi:SAM-dependent methyltransferase